MRYDIVNPSDPYSITGDFPPVAAAVTLLGEGAYGAEPLEAVGDQRRLPVLMIAREPLKVFEQIVGRSFDAVMEQDRDAVIAALRTVAMPPGRGRSSLNNIGARAKKLADALERKRAAKLPDPVMEPPVVYIAGATTEAMRDFLDSPPPEPPPEPFVPGANPKLPEFIIPQTCGMQLKAKNCSAEDLDEILALADSSPATHSSRRGFLKTSSVLVGGAMTAGLAIGRGAHAADRSPMVA